MTAADLFDRFGPIPLRRIHLTDPPGTATEEDIIALDDHGDRLCELVNGILVEKTMGLYESYLAGVILTLFNDFLRINNIGVVFPPDGMMRLAPGLVRIPDVSFISWDRLPGREVPRDAISSVVPDLALEVISRSNTGKEMDTKLSEYFTAGVKLVWYVYPEKREIHVFASPNECRILTVSDKIDGGNILPGFTADVKAIFAK
jgi:Uma2 family endonuclease